MSTTSISISVTTISIQESESPRYPRKANFGSLASSIAKGDLAGARESLDALQSGIDKSGRAPMYLQSLMDELSKAIDSGDAKGARDAFHELQTTFNRMLRHLRHGMEHHDHGKHKGWRDKDAAADTTVSATLSTLAAATGQPATPAAPAGATTPEATTNTVAPATGTGTVVDVVA